MNQFTEHFSKVKAKAKFVKPPSNISIIIPIILMLSSVFTFFIFIISLLIYLIVSILTFDNDFIGSLTFITFTYSIVATVIAIVIFKSYTKQKQRFKNTSIYRKEFKINILPQIIASKYSNINYQFDGMIDEEKIIESSFFSPKVLDSLKESWFFGDDYFSGKIKDVDFEFCELYYKSEGMTNLGWGILVLALILPVALLPEIPTPVFDGLENLAESNEPVNNSNNAPKTIDKTKVDERAFLYGKQTNFRGLFLFADFHKDFEGTVNIKTRKKFSKKMFAKDQLKTIRVENSVINKKYKITTTNEQMAYYVLSPKIIDAIDRLNKKLGDKLSMTLKNGKLYLIMPMSNDLFENITIKEKHIKVNSVEEIQNELNIIADLINELDLNTKIWSKA
ncbi:MULTISPECIES: DUF3137 domain-containing protein [Cellulophaga]|uniref:DUF3137 domain-containing protein n=1 Tax=Cellulophaga geojensis KL-A TaxID=1328323 RepID=A0ABN0RP81_9FLAO|nr:MULTISPECIES: DUF3137 domain-containing protein [Cellulophaga]EWH13690.1 hypothetical protein KLA_07821 [Cellulophaga geojensis KL-A]SNQ44819.1 Hypothetical membrane protein [Cellulophaga lytica]